MNIAKFQISLAPFEKNFNILAFAIDQNEFFFGQSEISRNQNLVILSVVSVSYKDQLYRNDFFSFYGFCSYGKQILGTATALLSLMENGSRTLYPSVVVKMSFCDHANDIVANIFDYSNEDGEQIQVSKRTYLVGISVVFTSFSKVSITLAVLALASLHSLPPLLWASKAEDASCADFTHAIKINQK